MAIRRLGGPKTVGDRLSRHEFTMESDGALCVVELFDGYGIDKLVVNARANKNGVSTQAHGCLRVTILSPAAKPQE